MSELAQLLQQLEQRRKTNKLDYYKPYPYQQKFHNATGHNTDRPAVQRVLMAGNGTGKTWAGGFETAFHATGLYPDWWRGRRFNAPIIGMVGGMTNEAVRDINQKILFGDPNDPTALGTGTVPLYTIGKRTSKPGVPNALDTVNILHVPTKRWSKLMFRDRKSVV